MGKELKLLVGELLQVKDKLEKVWDEIHRFPYIDCGDKLTKKRFKLEYEKEVIEKKIIELTIQKYNQNNG